MSNYDALPQDETFTGGKRRKRRLLGAALLLVSLALAVYLLVAYLAWQSGQALLTEKQQAELINQLDRQIELAAENIDQGSYTLAMRRLDWVLARSPGNVQAQSLRQQAAAALNVVLTPNAAAASPTVTAIPLPSPTPGDITNPAEELQRIRRLVANEAWPDATQALVAFQMQFPDYERQESNRLLYDAYLNLGLQLVNGERAELGLYYLSLAENLGDLPQEVEDYRLWAGWYLQGMGFYGVNWTFAVGYFRDLCLVAPFYQSSCELLHTSLVALGDLYAASGDYCPARDLYAEATGQQRTVALTEKLQTAVTNCANATPTPDPTTITSTLPITPTEGQQFIDPWRWFSP